MLDLLDEVERLDEQYDESLVPKANTQISISEFIENFGESLLEAVSHQNPAIYTGVNDENNAKHQKRHEILNNLKRKPFPAQQKVR